MDTLISFGGEIKSFEGGKVNGHVLIFSDANSPDLEGDFFTKDTDFDIEPGDKRSGYYSHGCNLKFGNHKIGSGKLSIDDIGVWLEGQLNEADEYAEAVMKLVNTGKMRYSTGALSHLVRREQASAKSNFVKNWNIGEWSITPTPAEPRTHAISLKSLNEDFSFIEIPTTERELERFLRDAGLSRKQAAAVTIHGFKGLQRDAEPTNEPNTESTEEKSKVIQSIVNPAFLSALRIESRLFGR